MSDGPGLLDVDPYSSEFLQDPYPAYAALRAHAPVYHVSGAGFYMVSSMDLVREVLAHPDTYANSVTSGRRTLPPPEVAEEIESIKAEGCPYVPVLNMSDPPRHTALRHQIARAFTPRALAWMDPVVEKIAVEMIEALPGEGSFDLVESLARPLPTYAICRILGLPDSLRDDIMRWSDAATASLGAAPIEASQWVDNERTMLDYQRCIVEYIDQRRAEPRDDVLSLLVQPDADGATLSNVELIWFLRELLVAGNETTTKLLADLILRMDDRPELWQLLRSRPGRVADLVEEGLRLASPVHGMFRRTTHDTVLGGVPLGAGATVFLSFLSANRDEKIFDDADALDPDRKNSRSHLSFGRGIHVCLGAPLARKEATICLVELARRVERVHVIEGQTLNYLPSFLLRGLSSLHVRLGPRIGA